MTHLFDAEQWRGGSHDAEQAGPGIMFSFHRLLPAHGRAVLADAMIGKYWTIFALSIVYCFGTCPGHRSHTAWARCRLVLIALGAAG